MTSFSLCTCPDGCPEEKQTSYKDYRKNLAGYQIIHEQVMCLDEPYSSKQDHRQDRKPDQNGSCNGQNFDKGAF